MALAVRVVKSSILFFNAIFVAAFWSKNSFLSYVNAAWLVIFFSQLFVENNHLICSQYFLLGSATQWHVKRWC